MKKRAKIIFCLTSIVSGFVIFVLPNVLYRDPQRGSVSLTFTDFVTVRPSSEAPTGEFAAFVLSNSTPRTILYYVESVEYRTTNGWVTNSLRRTPVEWRNFGAELVPFQGRVLLVPPPTNGVWRLRLGGSGRATGVRGLIDRLKDYRDYFDWRTLSLSRERFNGSSFEVVSGE